MHVDIWPSENGDSVIKLVFKNKLMLQAPFFKYMYFMVYKLYFIGKPNEYKLRINSSLIREVRLLNT